ncbi:MAG: biotin--[acetyl-CoA-carboxylase] ligase [Tannerellaceae bacterium]|jgi:BirA family biotin operon repressor/biotin-[acetyl-CoA-carboxylase] ligase|nr:biotin--[acetyl-CoA-carboxylase] ligase [Tannerellaceae bacterium]
MINNKEEYPEIIYLDETVSTNSCLRELLRNRRLPEGSAVVAAFQSGGRGQAGNSWESARGENLLFSIVLYPTHILAGQQFVISQIASLAVKETLAEYTADISIKWPNDIYWKDRKISGMLIENDLAGQTIHCTIIGIGINLNQALFESNAPNPVSLCQITRKKYDRRDVLVRFLHIFNAYYLLVLQEKFGEIKTRYMEALYRREGFHLFSDEAGSFKARIYDIEPTGHLALELEEGAIRRYAFKEIEWL